MINFYKVKTFKIGQSAAKFELILMDWSKLRENIPNIGKLGSLSETDKTRIELYTIFENDCWMWIGTKQDTAKGHQHGCFWYNKKYVQIHRLIYHNFVDDVPEFERKSGALQVNHRCKSEGKCINPDHLYLGTAKQNIQDCINDGNKNKAKSGEQNHNATLSDETIGHIVGLKDTGLHQYEIAKEYGVHQSQISRWWNNKTRTKTDSLDE